MKSNSYMLADRIKEASRERSEEPQVAKLSAFSGTIYVAPKRREA